MKSIVTKTKGRVSYGEMIDEYLALQTGKKKTAPKKAKGKNIGAMIKADKKKKPKTDPGF